MKIDDKHKNELINTYRTELFETDDIDLAEIDDLISNDDLKNMIRLNNADICELINKKPLDKDQVRKLLIANVNFYKLAKRRELGAMGSSFLMTIASLVDYDIDKLYDELNVGGYNRKF